MSGKHGGISRRTFTKVSTVGAALLASGAITKGASGNMNNSSLRLGGPVFEKYDSPDAWVKALKALGYSAAYCPVGAKEKDDVVRAYAKAAQNANIVIAEVGVWNNPISPNDNVRKAAIAKCCAQLDLADRIGARCCVNVTGSRGEQFAGPHPDNLTEETFDMIVETTRAIIDEVQPTRTYFTLETMPWAYPDSVESYVRLLKAIDRKEFAAHLDPVNLICSPQRYFRNSELIRECFEKLGPYVKSCHAKDSILLTDLTTHINEVRPGLGNLDYATFLRELSKLRDVPLMLEHLQTAEEYRQAAEYVRSVANGIGLSFS
jgi:sugar phosphate isomerase/epimerase